MIKDIICGNFETEKIYTMDLNLDQKKCFEFTPSEVLKPFAEKEFKDEIVKLQPKDKEANE